MFSKLKPNLASPTSSNSMLELNPIAQYFDFGKQIGSAGPELIWKIYDAVRKTDKKVNINFFCFYFIFSTTYSGKKEIGLFVVLFVYQIFP